MPLNAIRPLPILPVGLQMPPHKELHGMQDSHPFLLWHSAYQGKQRLFKRLLLHKPPFDFLRKYYPLCRCSSYQTSPPSATLPVMSSPLAAVDQVSSDPPSSVSNLLIELVVLQMCTLVLSPF